MLSIDLHSRHNLVPSVLASIRSLPCWSWNQYWQDSCRVQVLQVLFSGDSVITKQAALAAFSELAQHHGKQKAAEILKPVPDLIALVRLLKSELDPIFLIAAKKRNPLMRQTPYLVLYTLLELYLRNYMAVAVVFLKLGRPSISILY